MDVYVSTQPTAWSASPAGGGERVRVLGVPPPVALRALNPQPSTQKNWKTSTQSNAWTGVFGQKPCPVIPDWKLPGFTKVDRQFTSNEINLFNPGGAERVRHLGVPPPGAVRARAQAAPRLRAPHPRALRAGRHCRGSQGDIHPTSCSLHPAPYTLHTPHHQL